MKTVRKFEASISEVMTDRNMVAINNRATGDFAKQSLKSMRKIKRTFKCWLNCDTDMCFEFFPLDRLSELNSMLPKDRIAI